MPQSTQNDEPLDDFIARLLGRGIYRVDLESGQIVSSYSGKPLTPSEKVGYRVVRLYENGTGRQVRCHRVIAIALWGVESVRGKDVGHDDGHRSNNDTANLWLPETRKAHMDHDGITELMKARGFKAIVSTPPCAECGDAGGPRGGRKNKTPARCDGTQFGVEGKICFRCYGRLWKRRKRREVRDARSVR